MNGLTFVELLPVEIEPLTLIAIQAAVGKGIIVVECAGNGVVVRNANNKNIANANLDLTDPNILANIGGVDLDKYADAQGKSVLNRSSSDFTDSGAIVVGAAFAAPTHYRADLRYVAALGESVLNWSGTGSNYGSRVDCYASGQRVRTTLSYDEANPNHKRYGGFGATSASSSIVAGAALCVQGVAMRHAPSGINRPLSPDEMRTILSDQNVGNTPQGDLSMAPGYIGVMPNLKQVLTVLPMYLPPTPNVHIITRTRQPPLTKV